MVARWALAAVALLSSAAVRAQTGTGTKCGPGNLCPSEKPCCSQYGECGVGAYCLGGCDPLFSHTLDSCTPEPVCETQDYKLNTLDGITDQKKYLGDASKSDWVSSGTPLKSPDGDAVILTLSEDGESSSGTLLASTHYVWYGKITASMKTSRGKGVVSAFILLSDNKDEIDFEFVGTDLDVAQTNFYYQGITNYKQGQNLTVGGDGDSFSAYHTYEIDWKPDSITWSVDGTATRTLNKKETFNKTDNQYHYPQTPARVQLSLWPAGISKNGKGTVDWAGGLIDWGAQDPSTNGYYYSMYESVKVECYDPPSSAKKSGSKSYVYADNKGIESSIQITDKDTVLKSLLGTGVDMDRDYPKPEGTKSGEAAAATSEVATIPGLTGAGPGTDGSRGGSSTDNDSGGSGSGAGADASGTGSAGAASTDFTQGSGSGSKGSAATKLEEVTVGSMFAALMAFVGMFIMM